MSFKDFDAAVETKEPIRFKLKGELYFLDGDVPASVVLLQLRAAAGGESVDTIEWLEAILGKESLQKMVDTGVSFPQLVSLLNWLLEQYNLVSTEEKEEEEDTDEERPTSASVSSSSTGD